MDRRTPLKHAVSPRSLVVAILILLLVWVPAAPASANDAPVITDATVTPTNLPRVGGQITVSAFVSDDLGSVEVTAEFASSSGERSETAMSNVSDMQYGAAVDLPYNLQTEPVTWTVSVRARDLDQVESRVVTGVVTVAAGHLYDLAPDVRDPAVTPTRLPAAGGAVSVAVTATDDSSVEEAYVLLTAPNGEQTRFPLTTADGSRFTGTAAMPPNASSSPVSVRVQFVAIDDIGQVTAVDGASVVVAAGTGRLAVNIRWIDFGRVAVGKSATRTIVLMNRGRRGTSPVSGVVRTSGAPFTVLGSSAVNLAPGRSATFRIQFRPIVAGLAAGKFSVVRDDGDQTALSAVLSGSGRTR